MPELSGVASYFDSSSRAFSLVERLNNFASFGCRGLTTCFSAVFNLRALYRRAGELLL
jgi:hypothetical protein